MPAPHFHIMYQMIAISFTTKNQPFDKIRLVLEKIRDKIKSTNEIPVLVHGFRPIAELVEKGFSTEAVDALAEIFPLQLSCYVNGKPSRETMAGILDEFSGEAFIVGEIVDGVMEERDFYQMDDVPITYYDLNGKIVDVKS